MPRKARIEAPGSLHHIIVRGIKRRPIFTDDQDRDNFIDRLKEQLGSVHEFDSFVSFDKDGGRVMQSG